MPHRSRRDFLTSVGAMAGAAAIPSIAGAATPEPSAPNDGPPMAAQERWDMSWLDRIQGKHKQVFDIANWDTGLSTVRNWYDAHEKVYQLRHPQLSAVVGIATQAFPINASDAMWTRFPIGDEWKVIDPATGKPALRNIFLDKREGPPPIAEASVKLLQARGAMFWQCNNALNKVAGILAARVNRPQPDVYRELRAGLNPGVTLVVAHTMAIGLSQERGCTYEKVV